MIALGAGLWCLQALVLLPLSTAQANEPEDQLKAVEEDLKKGQAKARELAREADRLSKDLLALQHRSVRVAAEVMRREAEIQTLQDRLDELTARETVKTTSLRTRRGQYVQALMAISRMARHPPEALLAQPLSPGDTVRSAILLRAAVPQIEMLASGLREDLDELAKAKAEITRKRAALEKLFANLDQERETLKQLQGEKRDARKQALSGAKQEKSRVQKLAGDAKSLRELLAKIEAVRKKREAEEKARAVVAAKQAKLDNVEVKVKPEPPRRPSLQQASVKLSKPTRHPGLNALGLPVIGKVVLDFGDREVGGFKSKGIKVAAKPEAQVVATRDGVVVFAGPFRGYGQLLIIDHGDAYHSLIAGLGRIDAELNQQVMAGEPVGLMGGSHSGPPTLYFELRRQGASINPMPWLASHSSKRR